MRATYCCTFALLFTLAACSGKKRPFADEWPVERPGDSEGSRTTTPGQEPGAMGPEPFVGDGEVGDELPAALDGNLQSGSVMGSADGNECDGDKGDAAVCTPSGDAGPNPSLCVPTGPRDCGSGFDNDCDGQPDDALDDVCRCVLGTTEPCDEHFGFDGRGQCLAGVRTCIAGEGHLTSDFGACEGAVGPGPQDSCSTPGDDTDCDGVPNEGCSCLDEQTQACGPNTDNGICQRGTSTCVNGAFGRCEGAVLPLARDSCADQGDDSNCNGIPNDGCSCIDGETRRCGPNTDTGICQRGTQTCSNGTFGQCVGAIFAAGRICGSQQDNDCDGRPDNTIDSACTCSIGTTQVCGAHPGQDGFGACRSGQRRCDGGPNNATSNLGACTGSVGPTQQDSCTTLGDDANCNGRPNDGCACISGQTRLCGPNTDEGICQRGSQTCANGAFGECVGAVFAAARNCGSRQDNDCDGRPDNTLDNVCRCAIGTTQVCGVHPQDGVGQCRAGSQQCLAGQNNSSSSFGSCTGSIGPAPQDSCTTVGNDANCNGIPNGGCDCIAGGGNGPCSNDPNSSRCNSQGQCVPCQTDADCSLVGGERRFCSTTGGQCVARFACGEASPPNVSSILVEALFSSATPMTGGTILDGDYVQTVQFVSQVAPERVFYLGDSYAFRGQFVHRKTMEFFDRADPGGLTFEGVGTYTTSGNLLTISYSDCFFAAESGSLTFQYVATSTGLELISTRGQSGGRFVKR